ncbi:MAG: divalent metal cation transporter, partial [Luteibaculum sp.]
MNFISKLGPGLLYAGAAIGVSHLVQSTRAGAAFGVDLIIAVILVHVLKYGFFKAAAVYTLEQNEDLVSGYRKISRAALLIFLLMSLLTMHIVIAAIALVSAGLFSNLFNLNALGIPGTSALLLILAFVILLKGQVSYLSKYLKWMVLALSLATLLCVLLQVNTIFQLFQNFPGFSFSFSDSAHVLFLLAFLGWMPAPMDITVWQSIWIMDSEREKTAKERLFDFNAGYWGTAVMAILFILLGAAVFFQKSVVLQDSPVGFMGQFLSLYAQTLGSWVYPIVAFCALATMISTL